MPDTLPDETEALITKELDQDEILLWSGRPKGGTIFRTSDFLMIPFGVFSLGMGIFAEYDSFFHTHNSDIFLMIGGSLSIIVGLYLILRRFILDVWSRAKIYYGLTNYRVIIISGLFNRKILSLYLQDFSLIEILDLNPDGTGTIIFGSKLIWIFDLTAKMYELRYPSFEYIQNVEEVYRQIKRAQRDIIFSLKGFGVSKERKDPA